MANLDQDPYLTFEEAISATGCGAGSENACYALTTGESGFSCMALNQDPAIDMAGILLSWRMNIDPVDKKPWCPRGIIPGSKQADQSTQKPETAV
ncbi:hypothetical protein KC960_02330 [Candidatus Saccharibacteria bacterium]|nr:hypothetical protein [Candidatus Saccharibacteria bacterium]